MPATTVYNILSQAVGSVPSASTGEAGIVEIGTQSEVDAGADPLRVVTPETLANWSGFGQAVPYATEIDPGTVELATQSEADTGTDATRVITPATLENWSGFADAIPFAGETVAGKVELATQAEVNAGTDTGRVVTPATLENYSGIATVARKDEANLFTLQQTIQAAGGSFIKAKAFDVANDAAFQGHITADSSDVSVGFFGSIPSARNSDALAMYSWNTQLGTPAWHKVFGAAEDALNLQLTSTQMTFNSERVPTVDSQNTFSDNNYFDGATYFRGTTPQIGLIETDRTDENWSIRGASGDLWFTPKQDNWIDKGNFPVKFEIDAPTDSLVVGLNEVSMLEAKVDDLRMGEWSEGATFSGIFHESGVAGSYMLLSEGNNTYISSPSASGTVQLRPGDNDSVNDLVVSTTDITYAGVSLPRTNVANTFVNDQTFENSIFLNATGNVGGIVMDSAQQKRINWNDGAGNFNILSGVYYNAGRKYVVGGDGGAELRMSTDAQNGIIQLITYPAGTNADDPATAASSLVLYNSKCVFSVPVGAPFRGCQAYISVADFINSTFSAINFNAETFDTDAIHNNVTNNSRLTVPAGVSEVRLRWAVAFTAAPSSSEIEVQLRRNGTATVAGGLSVSQPANQTYTTQVNGVSGKIAVSAGQYFELFGRIAGAASVNTSTGSQRCWFEMEILNG